MESVCGEGVWGGCVRRVCGERVGGGCVGRVCGGLKAKKMAAERERVDLHAEQLGRVDRCGQRRKCHQLRMLDDTAVVARVELRAVGQPDEHS